MKNILGLFLFVALGIGSLAQADVKKKEVYKYDKKTRSLVNALLAVPKQVASFRNNSDVLTAIRAVKASKKVTVYELEGLGLEGFDMVKSNATLMIEETVGRHPITGAPQRYYRASVDVKRFDK